MADEMEDVQHEESGAEVEDATTAEVAAINSHKLTAALRMTEQAFQEQHGSATNWWELLGVARPDPLPRNCITSLKTLRQLFANPAYQLIDEGPIFARRLALGGKVICEVCFRANSKSGMMAAVSDSCSGHLKTKTHIKRLSNIDRSTGGAFMGGGGGGGGHEVAGAAEGGAGGGAHQILLDQMPAFVSPAGVLDERARSMALVVGKLAAGGNGAAGIPPSSISAHLDQSMLHFLTHLDSGLPTKTTILTRDLQRAVELVEARISTMLNDVKISLYIDGGSNHLAYGRKVMVVCASSLEWAEDLLLDVQILEGHESGETNKEQIIALCEKYKIKKENVWYVPSFPGSPGSPTPRHSISKSPYRCLFPPPHPLLLFQVHLRRQRFTQPQVCGAFEQARLQGYIFALPAPLYQSRRRGISAGI
jgi:hypothetical protein